MKAPAVGAHVAVSVRAPTPALAARQGRWIATLEPWRGLGYSAVGLARFLRRAAAARQAWAACAATGGDIQGILVVQPGVLLGDFVSLLAVRPEAGRQGIGRLLMAHVEARSFVDRRWLFVSTDASNRGALLFYRKMGFARVGRLPDLVRDGRTEILLRKRDSDPRA